MREGEGHENWVGLLMNLLARILSERKKKTTLVRSVGYSFCIVVFLHRRILLLVSFYFFLGRVSGGIGFGLAISE